MSDWKPDQYSQFSKVRLRPALDLLAGIGDLPDGDIIDLGCGTGVVAPELRLRWPNRALLGVDSSKKMLAKARAMNVYSKLEQTDILRWQPMETPSLIFSNAALQWVPDHQKTMLDLAGAIRPGGVLAVQMPYQHTKLSHMGWAATEDRVFGEQRTKTHLNVLLPEQYFDLLSQLGDFQIWQTDYHQHLAASAQGHPVRLFTQSTYGRPFLDGLTHKETVLLIDAYEEDMAKAYPLRADGSVLFAFRRLFFTLRL